MRLAVLLKSQMALYFSLASPCRVYRLSRVARNYTFELFMTINKQRARVIKQDRGFLKIRLWWLLEGQMQQVGRRDEFINGLGLDDWI